MVARQDRPFLLGRGHDLGEAFALRPARHVHHVPEVDHRIARVVLQHPFQHSAPEERLLGGTLRDLDIGVDRIVVVVQREAGRFMLLGIAEHDDRLGQRHEVAGRIGRRSRDPVRGAAR
jgi:hypothetical protein